MKYVMTFDLHTHTKFSHGKGDIEDNVKAAQAKGLKGIGISDHGRGHLLYGIKNDDLVKMRGEIERLKPLYPEMDIYLSVEANIFDAAKGMDVSILETTECDFIIAGYHYGVSHGFCVSNFLFNKGFFATEKRKEKIKKRNTEMITSAMKRNKIKILTHPGDKGVVDIEEIAKVCIEEEVLMEVSAHHKQLTVEDLKLLKDTKALFIVSSDAHRPEDVGVFEPALERIIEAGIDFDRVVNIDKIEETIEEKAASNPMFRETSEQEELVRKGIISEEDRDLPKKNLKDEALVWEGNGGEKAFNPTDQENMEWEGNGGEKDFNLTDQEDVKWTSNNEKKEEESIDEDLQWIVNAGKKDYDLQGKLNIKWESNKGKVDYDLNEEDHIEWGSEKGEKKHSSKEEQHIEWESIKGNKEYDLEKNDAMEWISNKGQNKHILEEEQHMEWESIKGNKEYDLEKNDVMEWISNKGQNKHILEEEQHMEWESIKGNKEYNLEEKGSMDWRSEEEIEADKRKKKIEEEKEKAEKRAKEAKEKEIKEKELKEKEEREREKTENSQALEMEEPLEGVQTSMELDFALAEIKNFDSDFEKIINKELKLEKNNWEAIDLEEIDDEALGIEKVGEYDFDLEEILDEEEKKR